MPISQYGSQIYYPVLYKFQSHKFEIILFPVKSEKYYWE
jgi:hypothetical protein